MMMSRLVVRRAVLAAATTRLAPASSSLLIDRCRFQQQQRFMGGKAKFRKQLKKQLAEEQKKKKRREERQQKKAQVVERKKGTIQLLPCYSNSATSDVVTTKLDDNDIREKMEEEFGTSEDLEFYDGELGKWTPVVELKLRWQSLDMPVSVRVPKVFKDRDGGGDDEEDDDDDYDDDDYDDDDYDDDNYDDDDYDEHDNNEDDIYDFDGNDEDDDPQDSSNMEETMMNVAETLAGEGFTRSDEPGMLNNSDGETISSNGWALGRSELHSAILGTPGALDHIVACLDYHFYWDIVAEVKEQLEEMKREDEEEEK